MDEGPEGIAHAYVVQGVDDGQLILGVTQDSGGSQYSISKMLCYAQSTQKVASVVVIPGLARLVYESTKLVLAADEDVFLQGILVEQVAFHAEGLAAEGEQHLVQEGEHAPLPE